MFVSNSIKWISLILCCVNFVWECVIDELKKSIVFPSSFGGFLTKNPNKLGRVYAFLSCIANLVFNELEFMSVYGLQARRREFDQQNNWNSPRFSDTIIYTTL